MTVPAIWARSAWQRWWFAPGAATDLAVARILVSLEALWIVASRDYAGVSNVPDVFWRFVPTTLRFRFLLFPGHGNLEQALTVVAACALIATLLGVYARPAAAVAAVLLYHLAPLETLMWSGAPEARGLTLAPTALLLLAVSPCADALAVTKSTHIERDAAEYGWALRLIQLLVCEIYLFSAIGKLERSGLSWGSAANMRLWLLYFTEDDQGVVFRRLGNWMVDYRWLCAAMGAATVVFEWTAPVALIWRRARIPYVLIALGFHAGVLVTMNIHVPEGWLIPVLVPWSDLRQSFLTRRALRGTLSPGL